MTRRHFPRPRDGRTEGPIHGEIHPVDAQAVTGGWDDDPKPTPREYRGAGYTLTAEDEYWLEVKRWEERA